MKPQIHLDPKRLKHVRKRSRGLTQLQVAQALAETGKPGKSDASLLSMYQVIEKTGNTSPERAESIANVLGVPLADIMPGKPGEQLSGRSWWFEPSLRRKQDFEGMLLPSASELLNEIKRECLDAPRPSAGVSTELSARLTGQKWSVASAGDGSAGAAWNCKFRPARMTDSRGIGWNTASKPELKSMGLALANLIFNCAHVAMLGENRIPRQDAKQGYRIDFFSGVADREPMYAKDESRIYSDELKCRNALWAHLDKHGDWQASTGYSTVGSFPRIEIGRGSLVDKGAGGAPAFIFNIVRVWKKPDGDWLAGPWPFWDRDEWVKQIKARQPATTSRDEVDHALLVVHADDSPAPPGEDEKRPLDERLRDREAPQRTARCHQPIFLGGVKGREERVV